MNTEQAHVEFYSGNTMVYTLNNLLRDPGAFIQGLPYM